MTLYKEPHKETNKNKQNVLNKAKTQKGFNKNPKQYYFFMTPPLENLINKNKQNVLNKKF